MKKTILTLSSVLILIGSSSVNAKPANTVNQRRACNPTFQERVIDFLNRYHPYCRDKNEENWNRSRRTYHHKTRNHQHPQDIQDNRNRQQQRQTHKR